MSQPTHVCMCMHGDMRCITMPGSSISITNDDGNVVPLVVDNRSNSASAIYPIIHTSSFISLSCYCDIYHYMKECHTRLPSWVQNSSYTGSISVVDDDDVLVRRRGTSASASLLVTDDDVFEDCGFFDIFDDDLGTFGSSL